MLPSPTCTSTISRAVPATRFDAQVTERVHLVLKPPGTVLQLVRKLEAAGHQAWCVGGAVRDALLGHDHLDWDIATSATPDQVRNVFGRVVPLGIEFGTVGVVDGGGTMHEITTFRRDVETDGRHARVAFGVSLEDDLARRDLTINALAWSPSRSELFDPFHGREDLAKGTIRAVGVPGQRMAEDRLRALRAIRFAARFNFRIEPETWEAITGSAPFMKRLSAERVRQEIEKTMDQVRKPSAAFRLWKESGAFANLVPSLAHVSSSELTFADYLAVPGIKGRPARRSNRITALFLSAGASSAKTALRELRFSNSEIAWIAGQVERWSREVPSLERNLEAGNLPSAAFVRRWISSVGRMRAPSLLRISAAVWCARLASGIAAPDQTTATRLYGRMARSAFRDPVELSDLKVDGDDLRSVGINPGPDLGKVLARLLQAVLEDPMLNDRDTLLRLAADGRR